MRWSQTNAGWRPILQYSFTDKRVQGFIQGYLAQQAAHLLPTDAQAAELLRDPRLQAHVAQRSGGAFGYAVLLLRPWLRHSLLSQQLQARLLTLQLWRDRPDRLPEGIYGLRARELLDAEAGLQQLLRDQPAPVQQQHISVAEVLATLAVLRAPYSAADLSELWRHRLPEAQAIAMHEAMKLALGAAAPFLVAPWTDGEGRQHSALQLGHQSLAEVALAAWRLGLLGQPYAGGTPRAHGIGLLARELADSDTSNPTDYSDEELQQADARLHARLAERCQRWWRDQEQPAPGRPWLNTDQRIRTAHAYALTWGPLHALIAAQHLGQHLGQHQPEHQALGERARALLIHAPYLQSAVRSQRALGGAEAAGATPLRLTCIQADNLTGDDPDRALRHRMESALLEWFVHLDSGAAQVGGVLWNLLGADAQGQAHAQAWKASLDQPAVITELPAR